VIGFAGLFAGVGTTIFAPVLIPTSLVFAIKQRHWKMPIWIFPVVIPILISTIINGKIEGYFIFVAIIFGGMWLPVIGKNRAFYHGLTIGITLLSVFTLFDTYYRPDGLFKNALAGGQITSLVYIGSSGNILLPFIAGYTASRTPLLMLLASYFVLPKWFYVLGIALFALGFSLQAYKTQQEHPTLKNRFSLTEIKKEQIRRTEINTATIEPLPGDYPVRTFRPFGYGIANYKHSLGIQRPHMAILSLWWQTGLLSIPVMLTLLWLALRKLGWQATLPLMPALMLDDFLVADVSGVIALMFYVTLLKFRSQAV
jgi:hypothetical protein